MYQRPAGSKVIRENTDASAIPSSNINNSNNNSRLTNNLNMGSIHSANYRLQPPPSYYSPHMIDTVIHTEPRYLSNWCVNVTTVNKSLVAALSGTLLENDQKTISREYFDAGKLDFVISKSMVKTTNGVYHLLGPITQGYPNNLYRACLEADGIPRTWKYVLTQFSGTATDDKQIMTSPNDNALANSIGERVQELITSYRVLRHMAIIADRRLKEHTNARKSISFVRYQFQQKLAYSLKVVNDQIIMGLKTLLKKDESRNKVCKIQKH